MSSKKITKKESEEMLKMLKNFKKLNKHYNITCYSQLLINTDFYRFESDFKEIFEELLPFTYHLKTIIDYCNNYVENASLLRFDELENIIKENEEQEQEQEEDNDDEILKEI